MSYSGCESLDRSTASLNEREQIVPTMKMCSCLRSEWIVWTITEGPEY